MGRILVGSIGSAIYGLSVVGIGMHLRSDPNIILACATVTVVGVAIACAIVKGDHE